jgi:hypothetical protein
MFEFRIVELRKGDEFTADNGDSWWKVLSTRPGNGGYEVEAECLTTQNVAYHSGQQGGFLFLMTDRVIVR